MLESVPFLLDSFLLDYHLGHALVLAFVASVLGSFALSKRLLSLNVLVFGMLFMLAPNNLAPLPYKMLGVVLVVLGPILYTTART